METIRLKARVENDGHVRIDISTPYTSGDVELLVVMEKKETGVKGYDFSDLAGRLNWAGDALKTQRALRNEWE